MKRHLVLATLAACLLECTTTAVGAKPSHYYSRAEVDRLIDQLRSELLSKVPPKLEPAAPPPAPPQGYSRAEVDDLLTKLRSDIEKDAAKKQDVAEVTQPFVTSQQLDNAIDEATKTAELRENAIDNKKSQLPALDISPLVACSPNLRDSYLALEPPAPLRALTSSYMQVYDGVCEVCGASRRGACRHCRSRTRAEKHSFNIDYKKVSLKSPHSRARVRC